MSTDKQDLLDAPTPEACWSLVERVAAASSLKRAARLREFLLFVGTKALKEGRTNIHEQEVGESVFGRPRAYETSQDNIVRVSATELRKRVDAYFAGEGSAEPIIFEIPRGSYMPTFRLRESATSPAVPAPERTDSTVPSNAAPASRAPASQRDRTVWIVSAVAVLLAIVCVLLWLRNATLMRRIHFLEGHQTAALSVGPRANLSESINEV